MARQRLQQLDVLRAIAFVFVVIQHTLGGYSYIPGIRRYEYLTMKFLYVLAKPAVPIFLMLSGFALYYAYSESFSIREYYSKRVKFVLIPYVIWSVINIIKLGTPDRLRSLALQVAAGNGAYHFWYMGMIIRLYLWFPLILWLAKAVHRQRNWIRVAAACLTMIAHYQLTAHQGAIAAGIARAIFIQPTDLELRMINISPLFWMIYFILGICMAMNYQQVALLMQRYRSLVVACFLPAFAYAYLQEMNLAPFVGLNHLAYLLMSILFMYLLASWLSQNKLVSVIGKFLSDYSFAAYMAHVIVIQKVSNSIILKIGNGSYLLVGLLTLLTTIVYTTILVWAMGLIPFHQYLTGTNRGLSFRLIKQSALFCYDVVSRLLPAIAKRADSLRRGLSQ